MKIIILILLFYSICGVHLTIPFYKKGNVTLSIQTDKICVVIALILYCIMVF